LGSFGFLAAAVLPLAAGVGGLARFNRPEFGAGYARPIWTCAGLCAVDALVALITIQGSTSKPRAA
jgi:hypothetical protein